MPGANEVLGCPRKYFLFVPQNFWIFLLVVHQTFSNSSPKSSDNLFRNLSKFNIFSHQLSNLKKVRSLDAPASCPGNDIFLIFFLSFTYFFLRKLAPWMPPIGWMPGVIAPFAPPSASHWIERCFIHCRLLE